MPDRDTIKLSTLTDLERQVRQRYGRAAEPLLANLPLDFDQRVRALRRMVGDDDTKPIERQATRDG